MLEIQNPREFREEFNARFWKTDRMKNHVRKHLAQTYMNSPNLMPDPLHPANAPIMVIHRGFNNLKTQICTQCIDKT